MLMVESYSSGIDIWRRNKTSIAYITKKKQQKTAIEFDGRECKPCFELIWSESKNTEVGWTSRKQNNHIGM